MTDSLPQKMATLICQHNRITRDMPSAEEIEKALPLAEKLVRLFNHELKLSILRKHEIGNAKHKAAAALGAMEFDAAAYLPHPIVRNLLNDILKLPEDFTQEEMDGVIVFTKEGIPL